MEQHPAGHADTPKTIESLKALRAESSENSKRIETWKVGKHCKTLHDHVFMCFQNQLRKSLSHKARKQKLMRNIITANCRTICRTADASRHIQDIELDGDTDDTQNSQRN